MERDWRGPGLPQHHHFESRPRARGHSAQRCIRSMDHMQVVADCLLIESFGLVIDESSVTGEAEPMKKDRVDDPWVRSGTQVRSGTVAASPHLY